VRWLYHLRVAGEALAVRYAPPGLAREGFVHASYRDAVSESARLYFSAGTPLEVLRIDPRRLDVPVERVPTPRGEMPHILGSVPLEAIVERMPLSAFEKSAARIPDEVSDSESESETPG
jgi:uncharacterized protein (DUF952 family)